MGTGKEKEMLSLPADCRCVPPLLSSLVLGTEPRDSCLLANTLPSELHPQPKRGGDFMNNVCSSSYD